MVRGVGSVGGDDVTEYVYRVVDKYGRPLAPGGVAVFILESSAKAYATRLNRQPVRWPGYPFRAQRSPVEWEDS